MRAAKNVSFPHQPDQKPFREFDHHGVNFQIFVQRKTDDVAGLTVAMDGVELHCVRGDVLPEDLDSFCDRLERSIREEVIVS